MVPHYAEKCQSLDKRMHFFQLGTLKNYLNIFQCIFLGDAGLNVGTLDYSRGPSRESPLPLYRQGLETLGRLIIVGIAKRDDDNTTSCTRPTQSTNEQTCVSVNLSIFTLDTRVEECLGLLTRNSYYLSHT